MPRIDARTLERRLAKGDIVPLSTAQWGRLAAGFDLVARHDTRLAGDLLVVRSGPIWAAVERPGPGQRVIRPFADGAAADRFVTERLALYERVWDGCGCKVDYFN
jgi:hypothetical protein